MKYRKKQQIIKTISLILKIVGVVLFSVLVGYLLSVAANDKEINLEALSKTLFPIGIIVLVVILVLIFTIGPIVRNSYIKGVKNNCEKRRFKYLDTFFYSEYHTSQGETGHTRFYYYNVIEDCDSHKLYAIYKDASNSQLQVDFDGNTMLFKGKGIKSNWQRINYLDEGNFWIKEELPDFYKKENDNIILNFDKKFYYLEKSKKEKYEFFKNKTPILYNRNPDYDINVLDKVTFIDGYMEFDM